MQNGLLVGYSNESNNFVSIHSSRLKLMTKVSNDQDFFFYTEAKAFFDKNINKKEKLKKKEKIDQLNIVEGIVDKIKYLNRNSRDILMEKLKNLI